MKRSPYTAKQVDAMEIEDIEELANMMNAEQLDEWCVCVCVCVCADGYSGESFLFVS